MIEFARGIVSRIVPERRDPPPLYLIDEANIPPLSKALESGYGKPEVQFRESGELNEDNSPIIEIVVELKPMASLKFSLNQNIHDKREPIIFTLAEIQAAKDWWKAVDSSLSDLWFALRNKDYEKDRRHELPNTVIIGMGLAVIDSALESDPQQRVLFES